MALAGVRATVCVLYWFEVSLLEHHEARQQNYFRTLLFPTPARSTKSKMPDVFCPPIFTFHTTNTVMMPPQNAGLHRLEANTYCPSLTLFTSNYVSRSLRNWIKGSRDIGGSAFCEAHKGSSTHKHARLLLAFAPKFYRPSKSRPSPCLVVCPSFG